MKKIIQIILISLFTITFAQNKTNRFFYELTFKPNKDSANTEKEMMILDTDGDQSVYQSYELVVLDSILNTMLDKTEKAGLFADFSKMPQQKPASFSHRILKIYPISKIMYKDKIFESSFFYYENPNFDWKILPEKQKISSYTSQKATTEFGSRKWIAWFTSEIPIQDGPYKFYGLPGLIIKIEDEQNNFSWELKGNGKIKSIKDTLYLEDLQKSGSKEITKEKFYENFENYKKDPFSETRQMASTLPSGITLPDGSSIQEGMREIEKRAKEHFNKYNNRIEIIEKQK
ncbi:GLPGLI family protein [Chryseobacterium paridis]|uniref:GLPGLI family protein n=1 Tax=Chryseobacterium paridis TaxID=2800328 RepID=A0ABS1FQA5_9FLAO|nr:GLPGLI family protein [Chryseobacterium paridis]MBK1894610.1 GLPGLI family protein [Chryseobacterium paridis]